MKKLITYFLIIFLVLGILPMNIKAAEIEVVDGNKFAFVTQRTAETMKTDFKSMVDLDVFKDETKIYSVKPSTTFPYKAGMITQDYANALMSTVNFYRKLMGLPLLNEDPVLSEDLQTAAVVQELYVKRFGGNDHALAKLPKPQDMDQSFYDRAVEAKHLSIITINSLGYDAIIGWLTEGKFNSGTPDVGHRLSLIQPGYYRIDFARTMNTYYANSYSNVESLSATTEEKQKTLAQQEKWTNEFAAYPSPGLNFAEDNDPDRSGWTAQINLNKLVPQFDDNYLQIYKDEHGNFAPNKAYRDIDIEITNLKTGYSYHNTVENGGLHGYAQFKGMLHFDGPNTNGTLYENDFEVKIRGLKRKDTDKPVIVKYVTKFIHRDTQKDDTKATIEAVIQPIASQPSPTIYWGQEHFTETDLPKLLPQTHALKTNKGFDKAEVTWKVSKLAPSLPYYNLNAKINLGDKFIDPTNAFRRAYPRPILISTDKNEKYSISADKTTVDEGDYITLTAKDTARGRKFVWLYLDKNDNLVELDTTTSKTYKFKPKQSGTYFVRGDLYAGALGNRSIYVSNKIDVVVKEPKIEPTIVDKEALRTKISDATEVKNTVKYILASKEVKASFDLALTKANQTLNDDNATQSQVDLEVESLNANLTALDGSIVDKTTLKNQITLANELKNSDYYTKASQEAKTSFDIKLATAIEVSKNDLASSKTVTDTLDKLTAAIALIKKTIIIDKTSLNEEIKEALDTKKGILYINASEAIKKKLDDCLKKATQVSKNAKAKQEEIDVALNALKVARQKLDGKPTTKDELIRLKDENADIAKNYKYFNASKEARENYDNALLEVEKVIANQSATQKEVEATIESFTRDLNGLDGEPTKKSDLKNKISFATELMKTYTYLNANEQLRLKVDEALSLANIQVELPNATQKDVDTIIELLTARLSALDGKKEEQVTPPPIKPDPTEKPKPNKKPTSTEKPRSNKKPTSSISQGSTNDLSKPSTPRLYTPYKAQTKKATTKPKITEPLIEFTFSKDGNDNKVTKKSADPNELMTLTNGDVKVEFYKTDFDALRVELVVTRTKQEADMIYEISFINEKGMEVRPKNKINVYIDEVQKITNLYADKSKLTKIDYLSEDGKINFKMTQDTTFLLEYPKKEANTFLIFGIGGLAILLLILALVFLYRKKLRTL